MKESDKTLEQLFEDFKPELSSNRAFMEQLEHKLNAVEYIKQRQEAQIRHYKYAVLAALALGIVCGAIFFSLLILIPESTPIISFHTKWMPLLFIEQNSRMISLIAIASLMSLGIIIVTNMIQGLRDDNMSLQSKPKGS